jgi:hypothetical protein
MSSLKGDRARAIVNAKATLAFLQRFCCGSDMFPVRERPKPGLLPDIRGSPPGEPGLRRH